MLGWLLFGCAGFFRGAARACSRGRSREFAGPRARATRSELLPQSHGDVTRTQLDGRYPIWSRESVVTRTHLGQEKSWILRNTPAFGERTMRLRSSISFFSRFRRRQVAALSVGGSALELGLIVSWSFVRRRVEGTQSSGGDVAHPRRMPRPAELNVNRKKSSKWVLRSPRAQERLKLRRVHVREGKI